MEILTNKPNIFFTSDYHAFHKSPCPVKADDKRQDEWTLCKDCKRLHEPKGSILTLGRGRPFDTIEEHNEALVERHNAVVRPGDLVYYLGDFALKTSWEKALAFRRRLMGNFYFVRGNHDGVADEMYRRDPSCFVWMKDLETIKPKMDGIPPITLCHYAMRVWPGSFKGRWQLYGHSHGMLPELPHLLAFDVGVDCWNFSPVSIEEVAQKMKAKMPAWEAYKASLKGTGRAE